MTKTDMWGNYVPVSVRTNDALREGTHGNWNYWNGQLHAHEKKNLAGEIIFEASCDHSAVAKALKRFRLHERVQDLRDHLYPNRNHCVAICDVSRDSRREWKPRGWS